VRCARSGSGKRAGRNLLACEAKISDIGFVEKHFRNVTSAFPIQLSLQVRESRLSMPTALSAAESCCQDG
jgi:hypothetical protein